MAANFPRIVDDEAGATHTGMFLAWCLLNDLGEPEEFLASEVAQLRERAITPGAFFLFFSDGKLVSSSLSEVGNAFTIAYYEGRRDSLPFVADYAAALGAAEDDVYRIPDTWATYDVVAPVISERYATWIARGKPGYLG